MAEEIEQLFTDLVNGLCSLDMRHTIPSDEFDEYLSKLKQLDDVVKAKIESDRQIFMRINVNYRESSGLPLHLQAYCMRSEAKVGLGMADKEDWEAELAEIKGKLR